MNSTPIRRHILSLGLAALFSTAIHAQNCITGDDGLFTGGCCDFVTPNLPAFPDWDSTAQWITIRNCSVEVRARAKFRISEPSFIDCDRVVYRARFEVNFAPGVTYAWDGELFGKYSRTFGHVTTTNRSLQVHRFLLNGDFRLATPSIFVNPAQVPPSLPVFGAVHFVGHIDYACDGLGGFDIAASLQHLPGCIAHGAFSNRPLTGPASHPDRNYYLVAPGDFTPGTSQGTEPQGRIVGDDLRMTTTPFGLCFSENRLSQAPVETIFRGCPCSGPFGSMPWATQDTFFRAFCSPPPQGTLWTPVAVGPVVPAGLNAQVVGNWALPAGQYPEEQTLIHYQALVRSNSPPHCNPNLGQTQWLVGVGTQGNKHFSMHPSVISAGSIPNAVDLANCVDPVTQQLQWGEPATSSLQIGLFIDP